jgi:GT2 family glycosyltransferase
MKKIAIFCVTYNSYLELCEYLKAIDKAAAYIVEVASVNVFVADNTESNCQIINPDDYQIDVKVFDFHKNYGYFGAINRMMNQTEVTSFDFSIISNVDLNLSGDTFENLLRAPVSDDVGWIAPQIYSEVEHRDRNPKIESRYKLPKLKVLRTFYKYPILNYLYMITAYRKKKYQQHQPGYIYAGHGSFIILTKQYFCRCGIINYPVFLFGEEIYLAEQCLNHHLKVAYVPTIVVSDNEHASTDKMGSRFYNCCNMEAIDYVIRTYY